MDMQTPVGKILIGQILLIICCAFYLIFWSLSYRPDVTVNRTGGMSGLFLLITAVCGLSGTALTLYGINTLSPARTPKLNGAAIIAGGVILYIVLLLITRFALNRPVTTELVLITGWAMLELSVVNVMQAADIFSGGSFFAACAVIAAACVISMILYVLYYRMEPVRAFYAAMVPLVTEAVAMGIIFFMMVRYYR